MVEICEFYAILMQKVLKNEKKFKIMSQNGHFTPFIYRGCYCLNL